MTVEQPPAGNSTIVSNVMRPLSDAAGWMKLLGTLSIIQGVLIAITIVGLIIAWLPIWVGVLMRRAAAESETANRTGQEVHATAATTSLQTIFKIYGIIALIMIVFWVIGIIFFIIALASGDVDLDTTLGSVF